MDLTSQPDDGRTTDYFAASGERRKVSDSSKKQEQGVDQLPDHAPMCPIRLPDI